MAKTRKRNPTKKHKDANAIAVAEYIKRGLSGCPRNITNRDKADGLLANALLMEDLNYCISFLIGLEKFAMELDVKRELT